MGDGTEQNPYTREDVLRLIEKNGGKAEGLDISGKYFQERIDLSLLDLSGTDLNFSHLKGADLRSSHFKQTDLRGTLLEESLLQNACFEETDLRHAQLIGALLIDVEFHSDTRLDGVFWGDYVLMEERIGWFAPAADTYRRLKTWYTEHGMYNIAGEFFYREMTVKRKSLPWQPNPFPRAWSKFISLICGYGERPLRVIGWAASLITGLALVYFLIGSTWEWWAFWNSLYFSMVSFTALGYGGWVNISNDWIKGVGAFESFIGVFSIALFLVTFTRKMTR